MTDKSAPLETGGLPELPEPTCFVPQAGRNFVANVHAYTADQMRAYAASAALASRVAPQEPDMPAICAALGFDPTNHHNAAKCPYCSPRPAALVEPYDDTLQPFLALMRKELHANSNKGDRPGWLSMSRNTALLEIYWHTAKLSAAVKNGQAAAISEHAADVANMAMMLLDVCGGLPALAAPAVAVDPLVAEIETETSVHQVEQSSVAAAARRTATDFAIEFAEYMAKRAEQLLDALEAEDAAHIALNEFDEDEHMGDIIDADARHVAAIDARCEQANSLRSGIFEFRRRATRAAIKANEGDAG